MRAALHEGAQLAEIETCMGMITITAHDGDDDSTDEPPETFSVVLNSRHVIAVDVESLSAALRRAAQYVDDECG